MIELTYASMFYSFWLCFSVTEQTNEIFTSFKWMHTQYLKNTYRLNSNVIEEAIPSLLIIIKVPCNITYVSQKISLRVNQCYQIKREKEKNLFGQFFEMKFAELIVMASLIFP